MTAGLTCTSRRQQPQLSRAPHGRGPVTDLELGLDVADVSADGALEKDSSQHPELGRSRLRRAASMMCTVTSGVSVNRRIGWLSEAAADVAATDDRQRAFRISHRAPLSVMWFSRQKPTWPRCGISRPSTFTTTQVLRQDGEVITEYR